MNKKDGKKSPPGTHLVVKPKRTIPVTESFSVVYYLVLAFVCLLVHSQTLSFEFTHFDDDSIIIDKKQFLSGFHNIFEAFRRDATLEQPRGDFYRPLQTVTYIVDWNVSNGKAFPFHLTNLLLYCITCTLILRLTRIIFPGTPILIPFAVVMAFAVNPFLVQTVAWIPARGDLLLALFGVVSVICLLEFKKSKKPILLFCHFLSFILALFSKETAVLLPLVYLAVSVAGEKGPIRRVALTGFVWFICIAAYLFIRSAAIGNTLEPVGGGIRLLTNLRVIPEAIAGFLFPFKLSPIPTYNSVFSIVGIVLLAFFVWRIGSTGYNRSFLLIGLAWYVLLSLPAMAYDNKASGGYDYLPHRAFLPLVGMLIATIASVPCEWKLKKAFWLPAAVILVYAVTTIHYAGIFSNPTLFCNAAIKANRNSPNAYVARASLRGDFGDIQGAIMDYTQALRLLPTHRTALINRANILAEAGDTQSAFIDFAAIIHAKPEWAKPYLDRGKWRLSAGNIAGAKSDFDSAIAIDSGYSDAYNNLGTICLMQNDTNSAERYYLKAVSLNRSGGDALYNYGLVRFWKNDLRGACEAWNLAASRGSLPAREAVENRCR